MKTNSTKELVGKILEMASFKDSIILDFSSGSASTAHTVSHIKDGRSDIDLIACFDSEVSETVVRTIAKCKPTRALFRDSSFADSANKIYLFEIFKSISPDPTVKVI